MGQHRLTHDPVTNFLPCFRSLIVGHAEAMSTAEMTDE